MTPTKIISSAEEKTKPFQLVKYFTISSLLFIFLGTLILSLLTTHWVRQIQQKKSEDYALLLIENLNHQVFLQFIIPVALKFGKIQLRNPEQFERMDKVVRSTLHSFKVEMVNIYDMDNIVSYSFNPDLIGKKDLGGIGYENALTGKSSTKLVQQGSFLEITLGFPKVSQVITFAPLRAEKPLSRISGPVLGVVEIVQDLSADYKTIFKFEIFVISTCTVVMSVVFLVLILVVKRGEGIIERRARERLRLEEQLSRAKHLSSLGEMTAGISHEIRNPLGIIRSSAELLKKKMAVFEPANPIPEIIVEEAGRLNNIITDFLNFARPRTPNLHPCRIEEVIDKNITFLRPQIQEQQVVIHKEFAENLPQILADFEMLYQAFLNILINAMQAMPAGGTIRIELTSQGDSLHLVFEDHGGGVAEEILEKIWDPFFTTKEKGTGLGLGIVKNIIEAHDGRIQIASSAASGARVYIELPVKQEP